ncbi:hypothetical protein ATANTOWER_012159 [Ataeniobius toweri]|uniref:Uncharacterized protein n=1 Tax=Ataeniobius toweri TaxID=208326 RepID=A0ABU7BBZ0_9TELE|nr:hypothetical protein [Ataeniobius toweri]
MPRYTPISPSPGLASQPLTHSSATLTQDGDSAKKFQLKKSVCEVCAERKIGEQIKKKGMLAFFDGVGENTTKAAKVPCTSLILRSRFCPHKLNKQEECVWMLWRNRACCR